MQDTLHEVDGIAANVATGYHAVEFLLWGQDLNGHGDGAGDRPWTDDAQGDACTGGNRDRRAAYLAAATGLLGSDLEWMAAQRVEGGAARAAAEPPWAGLRDVHLDLVPRTGAERARIASVTAWPRDFGAPSPFEENAGGLRPGRSIVCL